MLRAQAASQLIAGGDWKLYYAPALEMTQEQVVDTTGAGDGFNGGLIASFVCGRSIEAALQVATFVAASNCKSLGARAGLPRLDIQRDRSASLVG